MIAPFKVPNPSFDSKLAGLIISLDHLRNKEVGGTTPPHVFFELKSIFHMMESLASVRIEGNPTTIADIVERKLAPKPKRTDEKIREFENVEHALNFVDEIKTIRIGRTLVSDLHKLVTDGLTPSPEGDGSKTPGEYRRCQVSVGSHVAPDYTGVRDLMEELFAGIEDGRDARWDLLKIAIAHHRFAWIHPFDNGNGRTVRLFTYAMLVRFGFNVHKLGRILNPTAVFCNDRKKYAEMLRLADTDTDDALIAWCEYVLEGIKTEIEKIDRLADYAFLKAEILRSALENALERQYVTKEEYGVLSVVLEKGVVTASDLQSTIPSRYASERSRTIRGMKEKNVLQPIGKENARKYGLRILGNPIMRSVVGVLAEKGFFPFKK